MIGRVQEGGEEWTAWIRGGRGAGEVRVGGGHWTAGVGYRGEVDRWRVKKKATHPSHEEDDMPQVG